MSKSSSKFSKNTQQKATRKYHKITETAETMLFDVFVVIYSDSRKLTELDDI